MAIGRLHNVVPHLRRAALRHDGGGLTDAELLGRFLTNHDGDAFAALVRRHGPMVLGVCRRVLGNEADAEDAFQATFLVLVRKAAAIAPRSRVGNWLYGVAVNTARKAKAMARARRTKERQLSPRPRAAEVADDGRQLHERLDEELSRLPDKYRAPIVLCDLEGKSLKDAAVQLGCPPGTVASRLARGRALLARRLKGGGSTLSGVALAALLSERMAPAAVPGSLVSSTVKAAALFAAGPAIAGAISAPVAALTQGVLKAMLMIKLKIASSLLLAAAAAAALAGAAGFSNRAGPLEGSASAQGGPAYPPLPNGPKSPGVGPASDKTRTPATTPLVGSNFPAGPAKQTERDTVEQLRRALRLEEDQKGAARVPTLPVGAWNVELSNGVKEGCEIRADGTASGGKNPQHYSAAKAAVKDGVILVVFRDDRVERWTPVGQRMVVEHWTTAAGYQSGRPVLGVAERASKAPRLPMGSEMPKDLGAPLIEGGRPPASRGLSAPAPPGLQVR